jgi:hypothetical protein
MCVKFSLYDKYISNRLIKTCLRKFTLFLILSGIAFNVIGQYTLYGVKNVGTNYQFIGIDCPHDSIVVISPMPVNYYGSTFSSCFDQVNQKYYYSTGQIIYKMNIQTGLVEDTFDFSYIHPFYLYNIIFNDADGYIYGIKQNIVNIENKFTRFDPSNGIISSGVTLPYPIDVGIQSKSSINIETQDYILQSKYLTSIDVPHASIQYSFLIDSNSFDTFNHLSVNCKNGKIYGVYNDANQLKNFFGSFDTISGSINIINSSQLPMNFYNQNRSGSTIDKSTDIFYFAGLNGWLYGIDINTGNIAYSHNFGPGIDFLFLESPSQFQCPLANVENIDQSLFHIYPNPTSSQLHIQSENQKIKKVLIKDINDQELKNINFKTSGNQISLDVSNFEGGLYLLFCFDNTGTLIFKSKFIKY